MLVKKHLIINIIIILLPSMLMKEGLVKVQLLQKAGKDLQNFLLLLVKIINLRAGILLQQVVQR